MSKFVNFIKAGIITSVATLALGAVVSMNVSRVEADMAPTHEQTVFTDQGFTIPVTVSPLGENVTGDGKYSVSFRFSEDWYVKREPGKDVSFKLYTQLHKCKEGNGNFDPRGFCLEVGHANDERAVALNSGNNYSQTVTFVTQQVPAQACGSFQTDVYWIPNQNDNTLTSSIYRTDVNCPEPTPTPTPTPSVKPSPNPSTIQCPVGKVSHVVDSTIVCVSQNQNQNQTQTQNNNQDQTVNQNVNATGGNSSSSSSSSSNVSLTVNNPVSTNTNTVNNTVIKEVAATTTTPQVVMQTKGGVSELPKTGLPLAAVALSGLVPGGLAFKRFGKKDSAEQSANDIWTERQLNS